MKKSITLVFALSLALVGSPALKAENTNRCGCESTTESVVDSTKTSGLQSLASFVENVYSYVNKFKDAIGIPKQECPVCTTCPTPLDTIVLTADAPTERTKVRPGESVPATDVVDIAGLIRDQIVWNSSDTLVAVIINEQVEGRSTGMSIISASDGQRISSSRFIVSELTDAGELVAEHGGSNMGDVRFTLVWNDKREYNTDDLDAHCITPNGDEIYFADKTDYNTQGSLDVDIIFPEHGHRAVENITWENQSTMTPGVYELFVHQYSDRGGTSGFRAEIEIEGRIYRYSYVGAIANKDIVPVARLTVTPNHRVRIEHILPVLQ